MKANDIALKAEATLKEHHSTALLQQTQLELNTVKIELDETKTQLDVRKSSYELLQKQFTSLEVQIQHVGRIPELESLIATQANQINDNRDQLLTSFDTIARLTDFNRALELKISSLEVFSMF